MVNGTITHEVRHKEGSASVLLKPAKEGSGIIAGGVIRQAMELAGVKDITAKMFGSGNKLLNLAATAAALKRLR
jgi:small subunit ribosomal protein S5